MKTMIVRGIDSILSEKLRPVRLAITV
jgi:hypothetical protein